MGDHDWPAPDEGSPDSSHHSRHVLDLIQMQQNKDRRLNRRLTRGDLQQTCRSDLQVFALCLSTPLITLGSPPPNKTPAATQILSWPAFNSPHWRALQSKLRWQRTEMSEAYQGEQYILGIKLSESAGHGLLRSIHSMYAPRRKKSLSSQHNTIYSAQALSSTMP